MLGLAALAEVHVQFIDGSLGVGLLVAPSRHAEEGIEDVVAGHLGVVVMEPAFASLKDERGNGPGVVPPDLLGDAAEELEGLTMPSRIASVRSKGRAGTKGAFE